MKAALTIALLLIAPQSFAAPSGDALTDFDHESQSLDLGMQAGSEDAAALKRCGPTGGSTLWRCYSHDSKNTCFSGTGSHAAQASANANQSCRRYGKGKCSTPACSAPSAGPH